MIIYHISICALCVIAVVSCVYCYTLGAKHGRIVQNGGVPHVQVNPVEIVKEKAEEAQEKKEADQFDEFMSSAMVACRESMLESIKQERANSSRKGRE